ncbi:NAD(P)H-binding protein [Streptomyces sp. NPDC057445]|uniref:NAD(P)H-binding protein n=1 Tax=Streptomyces sp. NPDC057445 TaxID=3346136 RepID=UPI0036C0CE4A
MILVTGSTGTVGRELVRRLPDGIPVRLMTRSPERVTTMTPAAETVGADFTDDGSLARALQGVRKVFLVTARVGADDDARFLRLAREAGVRHVVKLSAAAVADGAADDLITRWQRDNEELLRRSGMEWTMLRPRAFTSNSLSWAASVRSEGVVRALYGSSLNACVDPRDIAAVAVSALTGDGHEGRVHTLTGPEAISAVQQTAQLAAVLGQPLRFEELGPQEAEAALRRRWPAEIAEALMSSARRQRDGAKAAVADTVRAVTGRPARSFRTWAADHAAAFAPPAKAAEG